MKALAKIQPAKGLTLIEAQEPRIEEEDEVIIEVLSSSICGTDIHIYEWDDWAKNRIGIPRIIGHEMVGKVIKKGKNVKSLEIGDIVAGESHIPCMNCYYCKTGRMHICKNLKVLGVDIDGCFAEYCKTKEISLWKLNLNLNYEYASSLEPVGNAVHAISETNPIGKDILVYGCGPIGIATIYFLKKLGANHVIGVDISDYRLKVAKVFGANTVINSKKENVEHVIRSEVEEGVDILFEMSGSQDGFTKGLKLLKSGSTAILFGIPQREITIEIAENIILKEIELKGVFGRKMFETWFLLEKLIKKFGFPFEEFITHRFDLLNFDKAFETLKSGNCVKVLLKPKFN